MRQLAGPAARRAHRPAFSLAQRSFSSAAHSATRDGHRLRVGVVGLGAIGTIFFTQLCRVADTALVASVEAFVKPRHVAQLAQRQCIALSRPHARDGDVAMIPFTDTQGELVAANTGAVRIRTFGGECRGSQEPLDVVLVALKAYDSARAIEDLQAHHGHRFTGDTLFVLLQNGLGVTPSTDHSTHSPHHYVNGVTYVGGRMRSMGDVVVSGFETEPTYFAPVAPDPPEIVDKRLRMLSEALTISGLQSKVLATNEMQTILWRKLIVNAAINPVAAVLNAPNGSVGACEWSRRTVEAVVAEAVAVTEREQVDLQATEQEMVEYVLRVAVNTKANVCSTLADLRKGARTEVDAITGQLLHFGRKHGVATPTNATLFALVKALETQQLRVERQGE